MKEEMNRKKALSTTMILLLTLGMLSLLRFTFVTVSAVPVSPYIMVKPEKTLNSTYTVGSNYTVSIYTNYNASLGSDLYSWQFSLIFNPSVLEGLEVSNGDLITTAKHSSATFAPGTFNNTIGKLLQTKAYFYHISPPPFRTSGPGTLAYVTFRVKGYGISDIHILDTVNDYAMLGGYNIAKGGYYEITDGFLESERLGHGFFNNRLAGDITGPENPVGSGLYPPDKKVDGYDLIYLGKKFGTTDPVADFTGPENPVGSGTYPPDGIVDGRDLIALGKNFGKSI